MSNVLNQAVDSLKALSLNERRAAIIQDVIEREDRYVEIPAIVLAELLGIELPPDGSWFFYRRHSIESLEHYVEWRGIDELVEELQSVDPTAILRECNDHRMSLALSRLTREYLSALASRLASGGDQAVADMLSEESDAVRLVCAYNDFDNERSNGMNVRATYFLDTTRNIRFDALVEDDGSCIEIKSPYRMRDAWPANDGPACSYFEESW